MISVNNISKLYKISHENAKYKSFRDEIVQFFASPFSNLNSEKPELFYALKNVSFSLEKGKTLGIIGPNGAGKSTLLKILSRIIAPTSGEIYLNGRISSLLEVGTGFHPELTGRENIFLSAAVLGMTYNETKKKFNEIVDFAEVKKFLDTPVKHFSSGMYTRLAFSVAAHLEPEILIVDEVLAVGDAAFQRKCLGKMSEVGKQGRTIIFVSHNMGAISDLCQDTILLEKGKIKSYGKTDRVIKQYFTDISENLIGVDPLKSSYNNMSFGVKNIKIVNKKGEQTAIVKYGEPFSILLEGVIKKRVENIVLNVGIGSAWEQPLYNSQISSKELHLERYKGKLSVVLSIDPNILGSGTYTVALSIREKEANIANSHALSFTVTDRTNSTLPRYILYDGYVVYPRKWSVQK